MTLIKEIFGNGPIDQSKINEILIATRYKESGIFEAKQVQKFVSNDDIEQTLIRPLASFLNSVRGNGVLCLGVKARNETCEEILPILETTIKSETQLNSLVHAHILPFPFRTDSFDLTIQKVSCIGGAVFLLEIKRKLDFLAYYSDITNLVYIRENGKTRKLSFKDTLTFVSSKTNPRLRFYLQPASNDRAARKLEMFVVNEGNIPAEKVFLQIKVSKQGANMSHTVFNGKNEKLTPINSDDNFDKYQLYFAYNDGQSISYPDLPILLGTIEHKNEGFPVDYEILMHELRGKTTQSFVIFKQDNIWKESNKKISFEPYI